MKKYVKKFAAAGLAFVMAVGMLTGCGGAKSEQSQTKVFTYDGIDVYLDEAWVYAKISQSGYENAYMATFGDDMWSMQVSTDNDGNPVTFEDMVKQSVISQIKQVKVLVNKAKELEVSLTKEEEDSAAETAKTFCSEAEGKAILEETGATEDVIRKIYEENALASKVQKEMVKDVDTEVSDDEARHSTIYKLVFPTTKTDEESGEEVEMTADEKKVQKAKAKEALAKIEGGKSIEEVAEELEMTDSANETYGAGEAAGGAKFEAAMAKLKDGEVSKVLSTEEGYVVAKMVAYTDKDATEAEKENIISERESEMYQKQYEEWVKDMEEEWDYEDDVDQEAWAKVKFAEEKEAEEETAADAEETTTEAGAEETTTEAQTEETTTEAE